MVTSEIKPQMEAFQTNIKLRDLQLNVISGLKQISHLMGRANRNFGGDGYGQKYGEFANEVDRAVDNVENLQLRMAIVAPMSAGKSTIINAIVGQDLLPSRSTAMTTLPTKILLNKEISEPTLILSEQTIDVFQETFATINRQIQLLGNSAIEESIGQYSYLMQLVEEVKNNVNLSLPKKVSGRAEISKVLIRLNDLIRLCATLDPCFDPLAESIDVPCIETPFWLSQNNQAGEQLGNLVIVDTPGPNEAGENLKLTSVVERELQKSSIVLIVLDFTQLNNKAAEEIKKQVRPIIDLIGQENLYVLINKVDQRRQGDMSTEEVKKFVFADLGLSESNNTNKVFEISAIRAFAATKFLLELQQHPERDLTEMETATSLAREVFGIDWEEELEDTTIKVLQKKAQRLWIKSGFAPFLEKSIAALMQTAAPRCLESALNRTRSLLLALKDDLNLRSKAISQDTEKLHQEIESLEKDLKYLETCSSRLTEVDNIKKTLQTNLNYLLEQLKQEAKISIEDYFVGEDYDRGTIAEKADIKARSILLANIGNFELFPKWVSKGLRSALEYKTGGIAEFKTELEAKYFSDRAVGWAKKRAESLLANVRKHTEKEITNARSSLGVLLEKETLPIIERANSRLQETFEIKLVLSPPTLNSEDYLNVNKPRIQRQVRKIDRGYGERLVKKRSWHHWMWIVPFETKERYKKPDTKIKYYTVSLQELVEQINSSIEKSVNQIDRGIVEYLDEDFHSRVTQFFASLESYLCKYIANLTQARVDRELSLENREELIANINEIVDEAAKEILKVDIYLQETHEFLNHETESNLAA